MSGVWSGGVFFWLIDVLVLSSLVLGPVLMALRRYPAARAADDDGSRGSDWPSWACDSGRNAGLAPAVLACVEPGGERKAGSRGASCRRSSGETRLCVTESPC